MCGPDTSNRPRGGALAALSPSREPSPECGADEPSQSGGWLNGVDLTFHTPGQPQSTLATHARLTVADGSSEYLARAVVLIHQFGDLTKPAQDCGIFRRFELSPAAVLDDGMALELELNVPFSLKVGADGIIGRRVSLLRAGADGDNSILGEGIVGFNCIQHF